MIGNEVYGSGSESIAIVSKGEFSAHNLKILIKQNKINKGHGTGLLLKDLALNDVQIIDNDIS